MIFVIFSEFVSITIKNLFILEKQTNKQTAKTTFTEHSLFVMTFLLYTFGDTYCHISWALFWLFQIVVEYIWLTIGKFVSR